MEKLLIDLCDIQYGYAFDSACFTEDNSYPPLVRIRDVKRGYSETYYSGEYQQNYVLHRGDLLIGMDGEFNVARWKSKDALLNQRVCKITAKDGVNEEYIRFALSKALKVIEKKTAFVTVKHLSARELNQLLIDVPAIEEQDTISDSLVKLETIISLREKELDQLDNLIKARFSEMFGDPIMNPKKFPCYTVGEVIEFQGGSQPDKKYFEYKPSEDNIRLIQIRDYKSDKYITYIPKSMAKRFCDADDIMIGRYGPPIFQILKGLEGSFNVALMKATPRMGNREFIRQFLKQDCLLEYLEGLSKRTAGQDGIQMDKLKSYPFPFPPLELQDQFAAFIARVDKSKVSVKKALDETRLLFDSLMQKYFG